MTAVYVDRDGTLIHADLLVESALRFVALRFFGAGAAAAGAIIDIMSANIVFSCLSCWMLCGAPSQASSDSRTT